MTIHGTLYLDFEAQSRVSLTKTGVYRYSADPSTQVMCAGWLYVPAGCYGIDDINLWTREASGAAGLDLLAAGRGSHLTEFIRLANSPSVRLVAHNAEMERQILREKFLVDVPLSRISCTAARAARMSLPRSLEGICVALGLDEEKDADGHKVLMKLCKPRRPSKEDRSEFWSEGRKPEDYAKVHDYCVQDVRAMVEVDKNLPELSQDERAIWETTVEMNERGVKADIPAVKAALEICQRARQEMAAEFFELFKVKIGNSPGVAAVLHLPSAQKHIIRDALKVPDGQPYARHGPTLYEMTPTVRRGMLLRQRYNKASVDKLKAFLLRVQADGRVRGSLTYSGAERTQRWSGSGIQPQNFPRGLSKKSKEAFEALMAGVLEMLYEDPVKTISEMLRGFILGPVFVGDFSQVEARVLAWLAQELGLLELFRTGGDPYCALAADVFRRAVTKADEKERFMGKQGVLGCGYQIGPPKFRATLDVAHDVQVSEKFAENVVWTYRRKYPNIADKNGGFWTRMNKAFVHAVRHKSKRIRASKEGAPPIFMGTLEVHGRPFAYIELPSGRCLYYAYPEIVPSHFEGQDCVQYLGRSPYTHRWEYVTTYGGKITENIVQALSRDLLAFPMLRLRGYGYPLELTVHDEVVSGPSQKVFESTDLKVFEEVMNTPPAWAAGLPLVAECFRCERYRK